MNRIKEDKKNKKDRFWKYVIHKMENSGEGEDMIINEDDENQRSIDEDATILEDDNIKRSR